MVNFSYMLVDSYDYDREIVAIAFNYFDRFLSTNTEREVDGYFLQLTIITSLFLACKLHVPRIQGHRPVTVSQFTKCCDNEITTEDIVTMERRILQSLRWRVYPLTPVTAIGFARYFFRYLRSDATRTDPIWEEDMMKCIEYCAELSVFEQALAEHRPSTVGLAAVMLAMEEAEKADKDILSYEEKVDFATGLLNVYGISCTDRKVLFCFRRLSTNYSQSHGNYFRANRSGILDASKRDRNNSPLGVADFGTNDSKSDGASLSQPKKSGQRMTRFAWN